MLSKERILHHLQRALDGPEEELRGKVERILRVANTPKPKQPGVPKRHATFAQFFDGTRHRWHVTLHRTDAITVEEVFADFICRKINATDWRTEWRATCEDGKPKVISELEGFQTYEFVEVKRPIVVRVAKAKDGQPKPSLTLGKQASKTIKSMNKDQQAKLLAALEELIRKEAK